MMESAWVHIAALTMCVRSAMEIIRDQLVGSDWTLTLAKKKGRAGQECDTNKGTVLWTLNYDYSFNLYRYGVDL